MSTELCSHIFAHLRIIRQNFSDFDGMGVVFPLCLVEIPFQARSWGLSRLP